MGRLTFEGQVAIVTGAGGGMGRAMALLLAERGAHVVVNDYGGDEFGAAGGASRASTVAQEIQDAGGSAIAISTAVGSAQSARVICDRALESFGRIDILINNAGVVAGDRIDRVSDADIVRVTEINFLGPFRLIQAVWPAMERQRYGRILNVSSNALLGAHQFALYGSSKAALIGLTSNAAQDGADLGIVVNSLLPVALTRLVSKDGPGGKTLTPGALRWLDANFAPSKVAMAAAALVSDGMAISGGHFCSGGGRIARLVHFATQGFFDQNLSPEDVLRNIDEICDTKNGTYVYSGVEDVQTYMRVMPFTDEYAETDA